MKLHCNIEKSTILVLIIALLFGVIPFPTTAFAVETYDFDSFTEEDSMSFVEQCDIDIPDEFLGSEDFPAFTRKLILQSYNNINTEFCFNYIVTQRYAEEIRAAVRSYMNSIAVPTVASTTAYTLQYNKVMDENGNWVTSGGYYNPKWYNYNCYAYSISRAEQPQFYPSGTYIQYQPGDMCGDGCFSDTATIDELALIVKNDLIEMGYSNVSLSTTIPTIDPSKELICVRRYSIYDYHFMRYDIETDSWYHKPGRKSILKYNYTPSNDLIWYGEYSDANGEHSSSLLYNSNIVFITYSKNQINVTTTDETARKYIRPNKDVFCELNFDNSGTYEIQLDSAYSIEYEIYDEAFDVISYGRGTDNEISLSVDAGKYYLRMNFESYTALHYVDIAIHTHSYTDFYEQHSTTQHKAYCECGEEILESHNVTSHIPYTNEWHKGICDCGYAKNLPHVVRPATGITGTCILCGATVTINGPTIGLNSIRYVAASGSYVLSNGVIVISDADYEAYLSGELDLNELIYSDCCTE